MPKNVLIVEDDPAISHMIAHIIRMEGFTSSVVADGRRAVQAVRGGGYDMVILDVMLPGLDGISILRAIREEPGSSRIPVVMLSAKTDDETTWAGWRAGCDYYMTKPFEPEELILILKRLDHEAAS